MGLRTGECRPRVERGCLSPLAPSLQCQPHLCPFCTPTPTPIPTPIPTPTPAGSPKLHEATESRDTLFIFHFSSPGSGFSFFFLKSHFLLLPRGRVSSASRPVSDPLPPRSPPPGAPPPVQGPQGKLRGPAWFPHLPVLLCIRMGVKLWWSGFSSFLMAPLGGRFMAVVAGLHFCRLGKRRFSITWDPLFKQQTLLSPVTAVTQAANPCSYGVCILIGRRTGNECT